MADNTHESVGRLLAEWSAARAALAELERAEHPDITDHHGRVWTWRQGDLYRHCHLAWPKDFVTDGQHGLPGARALSNPNYAGLCGVCTGTTA